MLLSRIYGSFSRLCLAPPPGDTFQVEPPALVDDTFAVGRRPCLTLRTFPHGKRSAPAVAWPMMSALTTAVAQRLTLIFVAAFVLAACGAMVPTVSLTPTTATPTPTAQSSVDCGPLEADPAGCAAAIKVALGPAPSTDPSLLVFRIEAPDPEATCSSPICRTPTIIVNIFQRSGGALVGQVPLARTTDSWIPMALVR